MTIYTLPQTDRLAADVNPVLEQVATLTREQADLVEIGALTVIGLLEESAKDLFSSVASAGADLGVPEEVTAMHFGVIFDALSNTLQPRLNAMRNAVRAAQAPTEGDIEDLVRGLMASLIGEEAAAEFFASLEEEDEGDEYGIEVVDFASEAEEDPEVEFEKFLADLFGSNV